MATWMRRGHRAIDSLSATELRCLCNYLNAVTTGCGLEQFVNTNLYTWLDSHVYNRHPSGIKQEGEKVPEAKQV